MTSPNDPAGSEPALRFLELADWRRRVADLYAAVRGASASDPATAWGQWCAAREGLFRDHPQSPLPAAARSTFRSRYWPYDPAWRFEVRLVQEPPAPAATPRTPLNAMGALLPVSSGDALSFTRLGEVRLPLPTGERALTLYWMAGYAGGLFLPFRDATNGSTTYGAGRYLLDSAKSADLGGDAGRGSLILDFNFAYHPSCAFDPRWSCPLAPPENRLEGAVEAGERLR